MKRSAIILVSLLFITVTSFARENAVENKKADSSAIVSSKEQISVLLKVLQDKNIDLKGLNAQVQKLDLLLAEINKIEDQDQKRRLISLAEMSGENLLTETRAMVAYTKRLELLYLMMAAFGALVIFSILFYSLYMYMKRNKPENIYEESE